MNGLYGLFWRWHFFAALIVIPFVLWQSVTGTLYLWSERWMDVAHPALRFVEPSPTDVLPSVQIAAALASIPRGPAFAAQGPSRAQISKPPVQSVLISDDPRRSTIVLVQNANGLPRPIFVNPHDGKVLGTLTAYGWLPGLTRALHGGWPIEPVGSWLLELGDGWAIVMLVSGLYMWWPRGRGLAALFPRLRAGTRILLRDLHACVAVWFSMVLLFFLVSALPWTDFWGDHLLPRIEAALGEVSPAGFSAGGASVREMAHALPALDHAVAAARARSVKGTLDIRLAPSPGAPLRLTNVHNSPADDRTVLADAHSGRVLGLYRNADIPVIPRLIALGIHVHQGDFGVVNMGLNTAFALSLIWLSATGAASWWLRRPKRSLGSPPKIRVRWPYPLVAAASAACILLPLLGASVLCILIADRAWGTRLRKLAETSEPMRRP